MPCGSKAPPGFRWCKVCQEYKPKSEFFDWPNALCKPHYREYDSQRAAAYTAQHPGWQSKQVMAWAKAHPNHIKEAQRRFSHKLTATGGHRRKYRQRVERDPAGMRAAWRRQYRKHYAEDPLYFYFRTVQRRARHANAPGTCTRAEVECVFKRFKGRCLYCGEPATTLDHIVSLFRGGTNYVWNIGPACKACNCKKSALDPQTFIAPRTLQPAAVRYVHQAIRQHERYLTWAF